ncbi:MAG TPA: SRPBCC family protein [Pirellulales bacterium]|nr:SRPBCC family protein [Pirellulales bacterium]
MPRPRDEVFEFFSDAKNLEQITPEFLRFHILLPEQHAPVYDGMLIDYRLRLGGIPLRWQSRIESFDPPRGFVDVQTRGPYRSWRHVHLFEETPAGTRLLDQVDYELPLAFFGSLAHALFVRRTLERIFDYREAAVRRLFGPGPDQAADQESTVSSGKPTARL